MGIAHPYVEIQTDLPLLCTKFHRREHARLEGVSSVGKSSAKAVKIFQYLMAESHGNVDKEKK